MEGVTRLWLPTHPHPPPTPATPPPLSHPPTPTTPHPCHLLIHAILDITVAVKKVTNNPAVLAN